MIVTQENYYFTQQPESLYTTIIFIHPIICFLTTHHVMDGLTERIRKAFRSKSSASDYEKCRKALSNTFRCLLMPWTIV